MNELGEHIAFGQRTKKEYTYFAGLAQTEIDYLKSSVTNYYYDMRGRLVTENHTYTYGDGESTQKVLYFLYEESDVVGFIYFNSSDADIYYYDKNPRGDVVGILDSTGSVVVKYKYDAFGNCSCSYSANSEIADINPIRYRSYYYDVETELYYLEARYYNPAWRRFISPDASQYLDPDSVNGLNLYAYCGNDPVHYFDPTGNGAILSLLVTAAICGAIAAGTEAVTQLVINNGESFDWRKVAIAGISGFVVGLIPGSGFGTTIIQATASSLITNGLESIWLGEEFNIEKVIINAIGSAIISGLTSVVSRGTSKLTSKIFNRAPNYSQYQHYYRSRGYDYSRQEIYKIMMKHSNQKTVTDYALKNLYEFLISIGVNYGSEEIENALP